MNLKECFQKINSSLNESEIEKFRNHPRSDLCQYHDSFGRWIRNNCGLWSEGGLEEIKADIQKILDNHIRIDAVIVLENIAKDYAARGSDIDCSLDHPDNISSIIMEIYHDLLNDNIHQDEIEYSHMHIVDIIPYKNGKYFGDDILDWLIENMEDNYIVISHPVAKILSSKPYPTQYAFVEETFALAFKLRWL